jgi:hypothetical protein
MRGEAKTLALLRELKISEANFSSGQMTYPLTDPDSSSVAPENVLADVAFSLRDFKPRNQLIILRR